MYIVYNILTSTVAVTIASTPSTTTNTPIVTEEGQPHGTSQQSPAAATINAPQSRFHFDDINITSIAGLHQHIQVNQQVCTVIWFLHVLYTKKKSKVTF